jgi:hypothetical protein
VICSWVQSLSPRSRLHQGLHLMELSHPTAVEAAVRLQSIVTREAYFLLWLGLSGDVN